MQEDKAALESARIDALVDRRVEIVDKMQELCADLAKLDLDIVRAGGLQRPAIAGTIGATIAGTIGATISSAAGLVRKA
jgi:hypothetical protein